MNLTSAATLMFYFIVTTTGLSFMKASENVISIQYAFGTFLYGIGYILFSFLIIRSMPLSLAFPIASAGLIVGTQIAGVAFLGETISPMHALGIGGIIVGIVMLTL
ncbi:hypothetical protein [Devosia sp.]|uniref:hypothetical protein n=1 Tax=Devosia sp. TaxID=1871048 RepID=UPI003263EB27